MLCTGCQQLRTHLARSQAKREYQERRKALLKYIPDVSNSLAIVLGKISERKESASASAETERIVSLFNEGKLDKNVLHNALEKTVHQLEGESISVIDNDINGELPPNAAGAAESGGSKMAPPTSTKEFSLKSIREDEILHRLEKLKEIIPAESVVGTMSAFDDLLKRNQSKYSVAAGDNVVTEAPSHSERKNNITLTQERIVPCIDLSSSPTLQGGPRWYSLPGIDVKIWC